MGTDDERHIGMTGISDPQAMSTTGCERGRGKEKKGGSPSFSLDEPPRHIRLTVTRIG